MISCTATQTFLLNICRVGFWPRTVSYLCPRFCYYLLSCRPRFPREAHLKFHLIWWKMCYQADTLRSSVSTEVFVLRSGSSLSPSLYIIPSDDISERRTGSSRALGGQSLKWDFSTADPCSGPLTFLPGEQEWPLTPWICEQPPSSSKWRPLDGSRPCLSREDGRTEGGEVRTRCVEERRGVKWRLPKRDVGEKKRGTPSLIEVKLEQQEQERTIQ